jgi:hypothetical protein
MASVRKPGRGPKDFPSVGNLLLKPTRLRLSGSVGAATPRSVCGDLLPPTPPGKGIFRAFSALSGSICAFARRLHRMRSDAVTVIGRSLSLSKGKGARALTLTSRGRNKQSDRCSVREMACPRKGRAFGRAAGSAICCLAGPPAYRGAIDPESVAQSAAVEGRPITRLRKPHR